MAIDGARKRLQLMNIACAARDLGVEIYDVTSAKSSEHVINKIAAINPAKNIINAICAKLLRSKLALMSIK